MHYIWISPIYFDFDFFRPLVDFSLNFLTFCDFCDFFPWFFSLPPPRHDNWIWKLDGLRHRFRHRIRSLAFRSVEVCLSSIKVLFVFPVQLFFPETDYIMITKLEKCLNLFSFRYPSMWTTERGDRTEYFLRLIGLWGIPSFPVTNLTVALIFSRWTWCPILLSLPSIITAPIKYTASKTQLSKEMKLSYQGFHFHWSCGW